ncbi:glycosyltransferase family 9 protein [Micromonospora olivasterospora]|uniref:Heptosyltransferase-2 n=1 Tax=Micromonospora olivasterospora TaxID=1880 RepID=A0A562IEY4_MICOL|nr:glycosyltransferase family 9 protein [Micromonospora olivasterospora]TWH69540.1 heptosyltransferase-2 [Micromonospora olivasterospora]
MARTYGEILVVDLLGGIGDLLMLLPAVHGLARRNPGARLRVLTHEPGAELVRADPAVTRVRTPRHGRAGAEREAVLDALAAAPPDLAVTTTRYDGIPDLLEATGARCVTDLWRRPPPDQPVGERYLAILHAEGLLDGVDLTARPRVHLPAAARAAGERAVARLVGEPPAPPVVLVTDAGMAVKRWPAGRWRELADALTGLGHPVLAVGADPVDPVAVPLPRGDLPTLAGQFAAVARRGGVVVGPDTGPVRLAAAAGVPTVGLFGPTDARRYGMARASGAAVAGSPAAGVDLQGLADCPHRLPTAITEQPCWWQACCPLDPSGPACLADLRVADVLAATRAAAGRGTATARDGRGAGLAGRWRVS